MNRINRSFVAAIVAGGLGLSGIGFVHAGLLAGPASSVNRLDDEHWKHPHMHHALENLKAARADLDEAEDIFKGHKEEAFDNIDKAIKSIHEGLKEQADDEAVTPIDQPAAKQLDDDHFPHLHKALEHLRTARKELDASDAIFKGHRDDAIEHTDKAIKQLEEAVHVG